MDSEPFSQSRPIGLHTIVAVVALIAVIALLLIAFYKPFPTITVINAADAPIENIELQTLGSEALAQTHDLGTLEVGESRDVSVRSYEVIVVGIRFELRGKPIEHEGDRLPLTQGQAWRITVEPGGEVTGAYVY